MDDRVCACSLPSSVTGGSPYFSTSECIASSLQRSPIQSFPFRQQVRHAYTPVGLCRKGKRRHVTGYLRIMEWLYLDVRMNRSKCISATYSHSPTTDDISIECTSYKGINGENLRYPFFSREGIASFIIMFAAKDFDIVAVVSSNQPSGKKANFHAPLRQHGQLLTRPFPQIPWPNPRIPANPAC